MTEYEKEFGVTAKEVENETRRIKIEKREYDDYGHPVDKTERLT